MRPSAVLLAFATILSGNSPARAQNLVPNGSFENFTSNCGYYSDLLNWTVPGCYQVPPGCLNACNGIVPHSGYGYQNAEDGDGFITTWTLRMHSSGGFPDGNPQKYASVELSQPLVAGQHYCLRLWMNLADSSNYKTGSLNAFFWYGIPSMCNYNDTAWDTYAKVTFDITQVDTMDWTMLEGEFTASGSESSLTLGAFQFGTEIDSVFLHHNSNGDGDLAVYFIDNVELWACSVGVDEQDKENGIHVWPNPAHDVLNVSLQEAGPALVTVHDAVGRAVLTKEWNGRAVDTGQRTLDVSGLAPGQYVLNVRSSSGRVAVKTFVVER